MNICASGLDFKVLNDNVRKSDSDVVIDNCYGQRYIGNGLKNKKITVNGTPGNALGAYLDGASIYVNGNVQDAAGDTMNDGKIVVNGSAGDALGYAMRGGRIYVKGDAGYRVGIHMKEYQNKKPVIIVGGRAGSFLGEYLAGGLIAVLGIDINEGSSSDEPVQAPVGNFTGTGMHGGLIFLRCKEKPVNLPEQVTAEPASAEEMSIVAPYICEFAVSFGLDSADLLSDRFYVLKPDAKNPYKRLYTEN